MKCSGKQHSYPSEQKGLSEDITKQKVKEVTDKAQINEENLRILNENLKSESEIISATLKSTLSIENVTRILQEEFAEWKQEINFIKNDLEKTQKQITEDSKDLNQKLRMGSFYA